MKTTKNDAATMTIPELVKAYDLRDGAVYGDAGNLRIYNADAAQRDKGALAAIKANKPAILAYLKGQKDAERRAAEEREAKIAAIPGLSQIKAAHADMAAWRRAWNRSFEGEGGGGVGVRRKPNYDFDALYAQYPAAAAYLRAEGEANKANYELASIGKKALERIIDNHNDYAAAIADMEAEIAAFAKRHMWD